MDTKQINIENILYMRYIEDNDESSFKELFNLIDPWLFKMVYRIVGDRSAAQDIVQQTWRTVIEKSDRFNPAKGSITNYIHSIAKNYCFKWIKSESRNVHSNNIDIADNHAELERESAELKEIIQKALNKVKNKNHLDAMLLFYFADLKVNEIKILMNTTEQNVKVWLHRGRLELEKEIKQLLNADSILDMISKQSHNNTTN